MLLQQPPEGGADHLEQVEAIRVPDVLAALFEDLAHVVASNFLGLDGGGNKFFIHQLDSGPFGGLLLILIVRAYFRNRLGRLLLLVASFYAPALGMLIICRGGKVVDSWAKMWVRLLCLSDLIFDDSERIKMQMILSHGFVCLTLIRIVSLSIVIFVACLGAGREERALSFADQRTGIV